MNAMSVPKCPKCGAAELVGEIAVETKVEIAITGVDARNHVSYYEMAPTGDRYVDMDAYDRVYCNVCKAELE